MVSNAQILANQANAKLSTGPATDAGKQRSRFNALRHGLTSSKIVLPHEDENEWESFRNMTLSSLRPHGQEEEILAASIAEHRWRIRRLARVETALLEARMKAVAENDPAITDGDAALAQLFIDPAEQKRLSLLLRYMSAADRAHRQAMDELRVLQMARREAALLERMREGTTPAANPQSAALRNEPERPGPRSSREERELPLRL
jgi:hypothetical protein